MTHPLKTEERGPWRDQLSNELKIDDLVQRINTPGVCGRIRAISGDGWVAFTNHETGEEHMLRNDEVIWLGN